MGAIDRHRANRSTRDESIDLLAVVQLIWSELPLFALIGFLLTVAATLVGVLAITVTIAAPLAAVVMAGPIWLAGTSVSLQLLDGESSGMQRYLSELRRRALSGIVLGLPLGIVSTMVLGTLMVANRTAGMNWLLVPLAVDAIVFLLLTFGTLTIFPLACGTELRGRNRWSIAIALAGRFPRESIGLLAAAVLLLLSIRFTGPFLALAASGPYCLLVSATVRQIMLDSGTNAGTTGETLDGR